MTHAQYNTRQPPGSPLQWHVETHIQEKHLLHDDKHIMMAELLGCVSLKQQAADMQTHCAPRYCFVLLNTVAQACSVKVSTGKTTQCLCGH